MWNASFIYKYLGVSDGVWWLSCGVSLRLYNIDLSFTSNHHTYNILEGKSNQRI